MNFTLNFIIIYIFFEGVKKSFLVAKEKNFNRRRMLSAQVGNN